MSPFPSSVIFISLCGTLIVLGLVFLSGLSCTAYLATFLALRVLYVVVLCLFRFCLSFVSWFSLLNPYLGTMSFASYFHARFLLFAFFPFFIFCFSQTASVPGLFWFNFLSCAILCYVGVLFSSVFLLRYR